MIEVKKEHGKQSCAAYAVFLGESAGLPQYIISHN